jgi:hypothetical protein
MVYMNVFYAPVAALIAHRSGGIQINLSAPQDCCRLIGFWQIAEIQPPRTGWQILMIHSAFSDVEEL